MDLQETLPENNVITRTNVSAGVIHANVHLLLEKKNGNRTMATTIYKTLKLKFPERLFLFGPVWNDY